MCIRDRHRSAHAETDRRDGNHLYLLGPQKYQNWIHLIRLFYFLDVVDQRHGLGYVLPLVGTTSGIPKSSCPKWLFEKRVQQLKAEKGISFIETRKNCQCRERRQVSPGRPHSSCGGGLQEWPHTTSHSLSEVQTDLTWPKGQKVPSVLPPSASFTSQHATQTTQTTTHKLSPSRNNTDGTQPGKRQSTESPSPDALTCNKNTFSKPHEKSPDKGNKKPRLHRPPRSDSEIATSNAFQSLYMDAGDGSSLSQNIIILLTNRYD